MNGFRRRHRFPGWGQALFAFGVGFAVVWWCSPAAPHRLVPRTSESPTRVEADVSMTRVEVATEHRETIVDPTSTMKATAEKSFMADSTIQKSQLSEWMRFRYEHPNLALSTEMTIRWELDRPKPMHDIVLACPVKDHLKEIEISAEIEIHVRDVAIRGWGCDTNTDSRTAGIVCDCILMHLPKEFHVVVPMEVPDKDLANYEGLLSIGIRF
jgi:hypothetical protein